jgi:phosphoribosyl 1,2-cyclic phosphate phosphodiesterase
MSLMFTILGCGSSGGVPRIGGHWGDCDPTNPKNNRRRCSMLITRTSGEKKTQVLIDTSPDMRNQLLDAGVGALDGVVFTHDHADHTHGLDDLRMIVFNMKKRLSLWADATTSNSLMNRFGYAFVQAAGSAYPPICDLHQINGDITIDGDAGPITLSPFEVTHGAIDALGFRIGGLAYLPDVSAIPTQGWDMLKDLDVWVIDALRRTPHPSHSHLENTLQWIEKAAPRRAILTNMHFDLDFATVAAETPEHVEPAFDGMKITLPV